MRERKLDDCPGEPPYDLDDVKITLLSIRKARLLPIKKVVLACFFMSLASRPYSWECAMNAFSRDERSINSIT